MRLVPGTGVRASSSSFLHPDAQEVTHGHDGGKGGIGAELATSIDAYCNEVGEDDSVFSPIPHMRCRIGGIVVAADVRIGQRGAARYFHGGRDRSSNSVVILTVDDGTGIIDVVCWDVFSSSSLSFPSPGGVVREMPPLLHGSRSLCVLPDDPRELLGRTVSIPGKIRIDSIFSGCILRQVQCKYAEVRISSSDMRCGEREAVAQEVLHWLKCIESGRTRHKYARSNLIIMKEKAIEKENHLENSYDNDISDDEVLVWDGEVEDPQQEPPEKRQKIETFTSPLINNSHHSGYPNTNSCSPSCSPRGGDAVAHFLGPAFCFDDYAPRRRQVPLPKRWQYFGEKCTCRNDDSSVVVVNDDEENSKWTISKNVVRVTDYLDELVYCHCVATRTLLDPKLKFRDVLLWRLLEFEKVEKRGAIKSVEKKEEGGGKKETRKEKKDQCEGCFVTPILGKQHRKNPYKYNLEGIASLNQYSLPRNHGKRVILPPDQPQNFKNELLQSPQHNTILRDTREEEEEHLLYKIALQKIGLWKPQFLRLPPLLFSYKSIANDPIIISAAKHLLRRHSNTHDSNRCDDSNDDSNSDDTARLYRDLLVETFRALRTDSILYLADVSLDLYVLVSRQRVLEPHVHSLLLKNAEDGGVAANVGIEAPSSIALCSLTQKDKEEKDRKEETCHLCCPSLTAPILNVPKSRLAVVMEATKGVQRR